MLRLDALRQIVPKSVNMTLDGLKLKKTGFPMISDDDIVDNLVSQWTDHCLLEWTGPSFGDDVAERSWSEYESACYQFADEQSASISHTFWISALDQMAAYCQYIAFKTFPDPESISLAQALNRCLRACALLDVLKETITIDDRTDTVLSRRSMATNVRIQNKINNDFITDSQLDIDRWSQTEDEMKVFKRCAVMIQKEACSLDLDAKKVLNL